MFLAFSKASVGRYSEKFTDNTPPLLFVKYNLDNNSSGE